MSASLEDSAFVGRSCFCLTTLFAFFIATFFECATSSRGSKSFVEGGFFVAAVLLCMNDLYAAFFARAFFLEISSLSLQEATFHGCCFS